MIVSAMQQLFFKIFRAKSRLFVLRNSHREISDY